MRIGPHTRREGVGSPVPRSPGVRRVDALARWGEAERVIQMTVSSLTGGRPHGLFVRLALEPLAVHPDGKTCRSRFSDDATSPRQEL